MDPEMTRKLEAVLDRVEEPESRLSIAQLGLVSRIRHHSEARKLSVFLSSIRPTHGCCTIMASLLLTTTLKDLTEELQKEFPGLSIEIAEGEPVLPQSHHDTTV